MNNQNGRNWTDFIYKRQIFGQKMPKIAKKRTSPMKQPPNNFAIRRLDRTRPLRTYHLREILSSPGELRHIFLGFSCCGNYVFSYREVVTEENEFSLIVARSAERIYLFGVWRFVPGKKLELVFVTNLFGGEKFLETLNVRVEQRIEMPDVCVVIGNLTSSDTGTLSKTLWHSVLVIAAPRIMYQLNFHVLYGLSSDLRLHSGFLLTCTCDELILLDLNELYRNCQRRAFRWNSDKKTSSIHFLCIDRITIFHLDERRRHEVIFNSLGDISTLTKYRFSYANQALQWFTETCGCSCVGLSDYHLFVDSISNDSLEARIFALFDVDTNERLYYEGMFSFKWELPNNTIQRFSAKLLDVTDRSKDPLKQQRAFNDLRKELMVDSPRGGHGRYELSNVSVLEGRSFERLFDSTGLIALSL